MDFSHTESSIRDVPVLKLHGDVDVRSGPTLRAVLEELLAAAPSTLIVDLSDVNFFDSTGLRVLNDIHRLAHEQSTVLALAGPHERVLRLFQITGLDRSFPIHDSAEAAAGTADRTN